MSTRADTGITFRGVGSGEGTVKEGQSPSIFWEFWVWKSRTLVDSEVPYLVFIKTTTQTNVTKGRLWQLYGGIAPSAPK